MKIGLIGAGRLGICLALLIEKAGYKVLASDNREDYIRNLQTIENTFDHSWTFVHKACVNLEK